MWRETTKHERNRRIWNEELADFMPARILDFHVHIINAASMSAGDSYEAGGYLMESYDFAACDRDLRETYPDRETAAVCFGVPRVSLNMVENNRYVGENCDGQRFFGLRLIDPAESVEQVHADVVKYGFLGYKPYLTYVRKTDPQEVEIREMLPDAMMEIADEMGLIVMLHIPRKLRLADPLNQEQLERLCLEYPRAKIVLAHIGRAYYLKNVVGHLERLVKLDNLYIDLAMLNHWEVLEYAFEVFPRERILYGSDAPIALAPGKSVEINDQYTYVTPGPWHLSISDDHGRLVFTSFLYEELRAIKKAIERSGLGRDFVEGLFYENGMKLLRSVGRRGGG